MKNEEWPEARFRASGHSSFLTQAWIARANGPMKRCSGELSSTAKATAPNVPRNGPLSASANRLAISAGSFWKTPQLLKICHHV
jgi:hypothetical protein